MKFVNLEIQKGLQDLNTPNNKEILAGKQHSEPSPKVI